MTDVFISYASDDRDQARSLAGALEARGWSVWWDRKILAGQAYDQAIEHELDMAKCVVVLWSEKSIHSEWVKNEAAVAAQRGVLVPALVNNVKIPLEFRRKQTVDLVGWDGDPSHEGFQALCDGVATNVQGTVPAARPATTSPQHGIPAHRRWTLAAIAVVAVVLGGLAYWLLVLRPQSPTSSAQSYPMTCHGGGTLILAKDGNDDVRITFQAAPGSAAQGLASGQCTWSDRALRPGEPTTICDTDARAAKYIDLLRRSDQYVTLQVYNDGNGCMRVTRVGA